MSSSEQEQTAQPVDSEPRVDILCSAPGFSVPNPETVREKVNKSNTIFHWGGVRIAKISPEIVVKLGSHITLNEAKTLWRAIVWTKLGRHIMRRRKIVLPTSSKGISVNFVKSPPATM
ncbi:unnamed protein product [Aspergillus oryzae RIB40]|uniref:DNA, SC102 n=1 Tax=Aspergillus oryzae (strain ATCC 42149 / RIB 40) TaxID=510516 RepID=Q2UAT4_ASPOR|nr:unnamed protein product [Aspergillus oryzae RIB40]BAE61331.1 unnamed protein product [Aspergillus oryzae RIB40]